MELIDKEGKVTLIDNQFSEEDKEILEHYIKNVEHLAKLPILNEGGSIQYKFKFKRDIGMITSKNVPEKSKIDALLHRLRKFQLFKEPANFNKVCNIVNRKIREENLNQFIKLQRDIFNLKKFCGPKVVSNGVDLNSEKMFKMWLNAYEYHEDEGKRKKIEKLHYSIPLDFTETNILGAIFNKVHAIGVVNQIVKALLGSYDIKIYDYPHEEGSFILKA